MLDTYICLFSKTLSSKTSTVTVYFVSGLKVKDLISSLLGQLPDTDADDVKFLGFVSKVSETLELVLRMLLN